MKKKARKRLTKARRAISSKLSTRLRAPRMKKAKKKISKPKVTKEILGKEELEIERAKFIYPEPVKITHASPKDLPAKYDVDKIVLQVRDTRWIHAYWQIRNQTSERFKSEFGREFYEAKRVLRVYDVSQIIFTGQNAHRFFDIEINDFANNWYIDTGAPGRSWCVDLGLRLANGRFITILRSNTVQTPIESPSWITDEEWVVPEEKFARLYGMGFGLGRSSPVGRGIGSMASPVKKNLKERK
jgi:hypothetical protein